MLAWRALVLFPGWSAVGAGLGVAVCICPLFLRQSNGSISHLILAAVVEQCFVTHKCLYEPMEGQAVKTHAWRIAWQ